MTPVWNAIVNVELCNDTLGIIVARSYILANTEPGLSVDLCPRVRRRSISSIVLHKTLWANVIAVLLSRHPKRIAPNKFLFYWYHRTIDIWLADYPTRFIHGRFSFIGIHVHTEDWVQEHVFIRWLICEKLRPRLQPS